MSAKRNLLPGAVVTCVVALVALSSCSVSGLVTTLNPRILFALPGDSAPYAEPVLKLGPVNGSYSIDVTLSGLDGHNVYLIKENVSPYSVTPSATGSVVSYSSRGVVTRVASESGVFSGSSRASARSSAPRAGGIIRREHERAQRFTESPPPAVSPSAARSSSGLDGPVAAEAQINETRSFWVEDKDGKFIQISATLRSQGVSCNVWVANANYLASSSSFIDNKLTLTQLASLADCFDETKEKMNALFGYEFGGAPGESGGRDGDRRVALLVYDIDYDYASTQNSGVLGYFWGKDYYPDGTFGSMRSNYAEILYFDSHFADAHTDYIRTTLLHEYQHMINFNRFARPLSDGGKELEVPTWYNEMLSMLAEDLIFPGLEHENPQDAEATYPRNSRIPCFLANTGYFSEVGLTEWGRSGDALYASYGRAFAFGAYLVRNWGGVALVSRLMNGDSVGPGAISAALYELNAANGTAFPQPTNANDLSNFRAVFRRYGEAYVFSGSSVLTGLVSFSNEPSSSSLVFDGVTHAYDVAGFDIWDIENWVKHDANPSLPDGMTGPFVWVFENYSLRPYAIDIQSCEEWMNVTGDLSVTINLPPSGSGVELYLMVR